MKLSAPIYRLKRQAKSMSRERGIPLNEALDAIARKSGFRSWSHLAFAARSDPATRILRELRGGDMLLLGARPGQGKTLLALELAVAAAGTGRRSFFFTLEYTDADVRNRLASLGLAAGEGEIPLVIDTSDEICAAHVVARLRAEACPAFAVIDYLQLLDQKRSTPELGAQLAALGAHARDTGAIIVLISQIDRAFERDDRRMPGLADVRLPNPADLKLFSRTCFLHEGELELAEVA
ncbi:DNA helicase [Aquibium sp. ELW1220]|uniref:DNA helicase n=1 Tax=Aquibium sp. ELW1220 TaxID=2976766 RepID=UPI0025B09931|nr:DNA helicase [Aquibium sp. ELW1220]MDN2580173.1 DNA helicase [Aquibium sp. ELW1220]